MVWPKLEVEPRKYRLRLLNGSDSRFYKLEFYDSNKKMYLIGTEQGFVENPVALDHLVLSPSERADVIVDFTNDAGKEFILRKFSLIFCSSYIFLGISKLHNWHRLSEGAKDVKLYQPPSQVNWDMDELR